MTARYCAGVANRPPLPSAPWMRRWETGWPGSFECMLVAALGALISSAPSSAQDAYPTRTVRFVVPFPAGSGTDVLSRLLADALTRKWGRTVISENVPGRVRAISARSTCGASAPDGHTMMLAPPGPIATNRFLFKEMTYNSTKWVPISWLTTVPYVLTVRSSFKGTLKDLIAQAKAGKITIRSARTRRHRASLGRASAGARRRQDGLRPLQGTWAGDERHRRRSCRHDVRHADDVAAAAPARPRPDHRRRQPEARCGPSRYPDRRGVGLSRPTARSPGSVWWRRRARRSRWPTGSARTSAR